MGSRVVCRAGLVAAALAVSLSVGLGAVSGRADGPRLPKRVVLVSWDGAPDWVVDRLLSEGKLPNVARLAAAGVRAESCRPAWPSKTACGHAAIWTGAYGDVNGISGNDVPVMPKDAHGLFESQSGFESSALTAEPLWITAARAGKKVVVLSGTHVYPTDRDRKALAGAGIPEDRLRTFNGFGSKLAAARVLTARDLRPVAPGAWPDAEARTRGARELAFDVAGSPFFGLVYDDPADAVAGLDTLLVRQGSRNGDEAVAEWRMKPREAGETVDGYAGPVRISNGNGFGYGYFRLFDLAPDGSRLALYQRGVNALRGLASDRELEEYAAAYGGFHDEIFFSLYKDGELGPVLSEGGDGKAERRLLETVRLDVDLRIRSIRYGIRKWDPDLVIHYTPTTDSAGHLWIGALDPQARAYDAKMAERLWPIYEEVFRQEDRWLGAIVDAAGPEAVVCLVSDHGMAATDTLFYPNAVLARAGLVARRGSSIDLARTKACVPPWSDFFVVVNTTERPGGIVGPAEREVVLRQAEDALLGARDPRDGRRIVTGVFRPSDAREFGIDGPTCGDLYFELAPGYYPSDGFGRSIVEADASPIGMGSHGFFPGRRTMQAICILGGPGLRAGGSVPAIRQIDIAPTLAWLMGIPPPKDARGHAIVEVAP